VLEELLDDRIQLVAMLAQERSRFGVAFVSNSPNLFIDRIEQSV
jgi:hypothetical protein